ncbi:MAG: G8 domain-containing protein [Planctomycetota bacterium]
MADHSQMPALLLVPIESATHVAIADGAWSNPATWRDNTVPTDNADVHVPEGVTVTIDGVITEAILTVRLDGTLRFATDVDTELRVDTLVSAMTGVLEIGTAANPVAEDVTARVVVADTGAIDRTWDPRLLSRGALLHGRTFIHGEERTAFLALDGGASAGSTELTLTAEPTGWRVGDVITVAGTDPADPAGDELVTITALDGNVVTIDRPLATDHVAPRPDLDVHVANLTRNVVFTSENTAIDRRGHVMFMHTNDVDARYVAFEGLGRTDKSIDLQDWRLITGSEESIGTERTEVDELGGFNVRGRYTVHFHRGGPSGAPAIVQGAVVRDDPGWAYVNHSSNVDFLDNVAHNTTGAAFNTEAGDEVGSFVGNIAIRTINPNGNPNPPDTEVNEDQSPDFRVLTQDFGWQGDGFWFHGAGVTVEDNVVSGATGHGFIYWTLGLVERGLGENMVDVGNLPNGELIGPDGTLVRSKQVPVPSFDGNATYNAPKGLVVAYLHTDNRDGNDQFYVDEGIIAGVPDAYENRLHSTFTDFTAWNVSLSGIAAPYSGRLTFENVNLFGTGVEDSVGIKLDQFSNENDITVRDVTLEGFAVGIAAQRQGDAVIDNAEIAAPVGIRINAPDRGPRNLEIRDVEFLPPGPLFDGADIDYADDGIGILMDISRDLGLAGGLFGDDAFFDEEQLNNVPPILLPDRIVLDIPGFENVGLYFPQQAGDFVPVPAGGELAEYVRPELIELTNQQLQDEFGTSVSDALLPDAAEEAVFLVGGLVGPALPDVDPVLPPLDPYWADYLEEIGAEIVSEASSAGSGGDEDDNDYEHRNDEEDVTELDKQERGVTTFWTDLEDVLSIVLCGDEMRFGLHTVTQFFDRSGVDRIKLFTEEADDRVDFSGIDIDTRGLMDIDADAVTVGSANGTTTGTAGRDRLFGESGADRFGGNDSRDVLFGKAEWPDNRDADRRAGGFDDLDDIPPLQRLR